MSDVVVREVVVSSLTVVVGVVTVVTLVVISVVVYSKEWRDKRVLKNEMLRILQVERDLGARSYHGLVFTLATPDKMDLTRKERDKDSG